MIIYKAKLQHITLKTALKKQCLSIKEALKLFDAVEKKVAKPYEFKSLEKGVIANARA